MRSIEQSLSLLGDAYRFFVGAPEIRLLHIAADTRLVPAGAGLLMAMESKADNTSPLLLCATPGAGLRQWDKRTRELRAAYAALVPPMAEAEIALPELAPEPVGVTGVPRFAAALSAIRRAVTAPLATPIVVLVPGAGLPDEFASHLSMLMAAPDLAPVRWIVLETGRTVRATADRMGPAAMSHDLEISTALFAADLQAMASAATASAASADPATTHSTGAGPGVPAPRRPHEREHHVSPEELRALGVEPAAVDAAFGARLRAAMMSAAAAMANQDVASALRHFASARDLFISVGQVAQAVTIETLMGATALPDAPSAALDTFAGARERAKAAGLSGSAARAEIGRAAALLSLQRTREATVSYAEAATLARKDEPALAIESRRMQGTLLAQEGAEAEAAAAWRDALAIAGELDPLLTPPTSAPLAARSLAAMCRRHGLAVQADSLETEAARLETPAHLRPPTSPEVS